MPNTNGDGSKKAILYYRVSGDEQKKRGYSLSDQRDTLRVWASENGYEVVEEIEDAGYSGAYLERPGLDRVRELVRGGAADAVVVLFRDRIARGVYAQLLAEEFRQHGARLLALNSSGDDSPDGELGDNILDVIAAWERKKIAERMNRGKRRKAKEGKLVAGPSPDYGFRYNENRDGYVVDEEKMRIVKRIFHMVGVEGMTLNAVRRTLEDEGVPSPSGKRLWNTQYLRDRINHDVYFAHNFEEICTLVSPAVAASLDPSRSYGVWWYGKERHVSSQKREIAPDGTPLYKKSRKSIPAPREEWVAVPVPDSGIPRDLVLAARNAIKENKKCSNAGQYFWELTGGIMRCSECGVAMATNRIPGREARYYRCTRRYGRGVKACSMGKNFRGETTEATVWNFISSILKDPERLRRGLNQMLAKEHSPSSLDAEKEEKQWTKKLSDIECQKDRLLDLYLDQGVEKERYEIKRLELERAAKTVQAELERIRNRQSRIRQLERDRDALLETYTRMVPTHIDGLSPEERHRIYKMMNLSLLGHRDGTLEISWAYAWNQTHRSNGEPTPPDSLRIPDR